jgi:hypothetical protein
MPVDGAALYATRPGQRETSVTQILHIAAAPGYLAGKKRPGKCCRVREHLIVECGFGSSQWQLELRIEILDDEAEQPVTIEIGVPAAKGLQKVVNDACHGVVLRHGLRFSANLTPASGEGQSRPWSHERASSDQRLSAAQVDIMAY